MLMMENVVQRTRGAAVKISLYKRGFRVYRAVEVTYSLTKCKLVCKSGHDDLRSAQRLYSANFGPCNFNTKSINVWTVLDVVKVELANSFYHGKLPAMLYENLQIRYGTLCFVDDGKDELLISFDQVAIL